MEYIVRDTQQEQNPKKKKIEDDERHTLTKTPYEATRSEI